MDTPIDSFSPQKRRKEEKPETKIKTPRTARRHFFKIFTSQLVNNCENYTILEKYLLRDFNYSILYPFLLLHHPGNFRAVFSLLLNGLSPFVITLEWFYDRRKRIPR